MCVCEHLFGAAARWTDCCTRARDWSLQGCRAPAAHPSRARRSFPTCPAHHSTLGEETPHWQKKLMEWWKHWLSQHFTQLNTLCRSAQSPGTGRFLWGQRLDESLLDWVMIHLERFWFQTFHQDIFSSVKPVPPSDESSLQWMEVHFLPSYF